MNEQRKKDASIFRRVRGRAYLERLAADSAPKTRDEQELERLKVYLLEWSARQRDAYRGGGGAESFLANYVKSGSPEASELLGQSDGWAMAVIDASIDSLTLLDDGILMRAALRVRYLNEGLVPGGEIKIRVFRSGRLQSMSLIACDELADKAEKALVPMVKQRGLPL